MAEAAALRQGLQAAGLDTLGSETQIVPVLAGDNATALAFAAALREAGLLAVALRPPTVPPGKARVRFSLSAAHSSPDLAQAREAIVGVARKVGLIR
jgi:7-keto-8-aminopelargonate synthetase-like enzyme